MNSWHTLYSLLPASLSFLIPRFNSCPRPYYITSLVFSIFHLGKGAPPPSTWSFLCDWDSHQWDTPKISKVSKTSSRMATKGHGGIRHIVRGGTISWPVFSIPLEDCFSHLLQLELGEHHRNFERRKAVERGSSILILIPFPLFCSKLLSSKAAAV